MRPLAYARGRVKRWTLAALLCVAIVTAAVAAMATSACLSDGSARASRPETAPKAVLRMPIAQDSAEPQPQVVSAPAKLREEAPDGAEEEHDYLWPVDGWIVQGMWAGHPSGIDIGANTGDPIWAVRDGTVIFVGGDPCCSYGNFVIIQHDHGMSSLYGHMSAFAVTLGQEVKQGDLIGRVGMTGKADGPHVHFELRSNGGVVDPLAYLWPRRSAPPPPPFVAAPSQDDGPAAPPPASAPEPAPKDTGTSISAGTAVSAAIGWFGSEAGAAYEIDAGSCSATATGPNWIVSCSATLQGCFDTVACDSTLTACVLSQPVLVTSICP